MATEQQVEKIREHVEKIIAESKELNVRINLPYAVNMRDTPFDVKTVLRDLKRLDLLLTPLLTYPIRLLSDSIADSIITILNPLYPIMIGIRETDGSNESTVVEITDAKKDLVAQLHDRTDGIVETVAPWVTYLAYVQGDVQQNIQRINESVETARTTAEEGKQKVDRIIQEASAVVAAAFFAEDFTDKATALEKTARWWLGVTGVLVVVTSSLAIVFAHGWLLPTEEDLTQLLQVATTKFLVLGLLFTATVWCGRMYKATKHQAAVNEFRANGLKTFQEFIKASDDATTRNAVLLETTRAIFAHAPTGLIDAKAGDSEGSVRIFEVAKDTARKATPAADDAG